jgi:hypothetical protein
MRFFVHNGARLRLTREDSEMKVTFRRLMLAGAVFAALSVASTEAQAQNYLVGQGFQPRLFLGAQVGYNHLLNGSDPGFATLEGGGATEAYRNVHLTRSGFDWSVYLGLRISPWIGIEVAWDALYHPSAEEGGYNYAMIDGVRAALRVHFPTGWNIEPYLRAGVGWYFYGDEFEADENGLGFSLGAGVNYQLSRALEIELLVLYRAWYFSGMEWGGEDGDFRCDGGYCPFGDEYVHSVNVAVGFHWNSWIFMW